MNINRRKFMISSVGVGSIALAGCIEPGERISDLPRPILGDEDAPLSLHVFDDFACPVCQDFVLNHFPQIKEEYIDEGLVNIHHYDFSIPTHPRWSSEMANTARAVQDQEGNDVFFDFKTLLYENQDNISVDIMSQLLNELDISNSEEILEAGSNALYQPVLDEDKNEGERRGVGGTPTLYIDGDNFDEPEQLPTYTYDSVSDVLDAQL